MATSFRRELIGWDSQPQEVVYPQERWLSRRLVWATHPLFAGYSLSGGGSATVNGTRLLAGPEALVRGFNTTFGAGSTDAIVTGLTTHSTRRTYAFRMLRNGTGGGTFGRVFEKRTSAAQVELLFNNSSPSTALRYTRAFSGGDQYWDWNFPPDGSLNQYVLTYDSSASSNQPRLWMNGVEQTLVNENLTSGTANTNADAYVIGNRTNDSARAWDGLIGEFFVFDEILTDSEAAELSANLSALWQPQTIWVPYSTGGGSYTHPTLSNARMGSLTSTSGVPLVDYTF